MRFRWPIVLPPPWAVAFAVGSPWIFDAISLAVDPFTARELGQSRGTVLAIMTVVFGASRVLRFHPLIRPGYWGWLRGTPWRPPRALPLGPVHLTVWDAVLVGALTALALFTVSLPPLRIPILFLTPYALAACIPLGAAGLRFPVYGILFLFGLQIHLWSDGRPVLLMAVALYLIAWAGGRKSLYHVLEASPPEFQKAGARAATNRSSLADLGWPFEDLGPLTPSLSRLWVHTFFACLLIGWYGFIIVEKIPDQDRLPMLFVANIGIVLGVYAMAHLPFGVKHRAPLTLGGRLVLLKFIIPGYDRIWLTWFGLLLGAGLGPFILIRMGLPLSVSFPIVLSLCLLPSIGADASLGRMHLTGPVRLDPRGYKKMQHYVSA